MTRRQTAANGIRLIPLEPPVRLAHGNAATGPMVANQDPEGGTVVDIQMMDQRGPRIDLHVFVGKILEIPRHEVSHGGRLIGVNPGNDAERPKLVLNIALASAFSTSVGSTVLGTGTAICAGSLLAAFSRLAAPERIEKHRDQERRTRHIPCRP